jgi:hypothetical protein
MTGAEAGFSVAYAPGCLDVSGAVSIACATTSGFQEALSAASGASVAIVVVGLCSDDCPSKDDGPVHEAEGCDRVNTTLPGNQEALVQVRAKSVGDDAELHSGAH